MQSHAEKFNCIWNWNLMLFLLHAIPEQREKAHWDKSFYKVAFKKTKFSDYLNVLCH